MGIDAVVLLKGNAEGLPPGLHVRRLADGVLVHGGVSFGGEPDEHAMWIRASLGDALAGHDDDRGVFVLPDVAEPRATTYEGVVEEIGEAGMWVQVGAPGAIPARFAAAPEGSLEAAIAAGMAAMGPDLLAEMQRAAMSGDPAAFARVQQRMMEALGAEKIEAIAQSLGLAIEGEAGEGDEGGEEGGRGQT